MLEAMKQLMRYFSKVAAEKFLKEKQAGEGGRTTLVLMKNKQKQPTNQPTKQIKKKKQFRTDYCI